MAATQASKLSRAIPTDAFAKLKRSIVYFLAKPIHLPLLVINVSKRHQRQHAEHDQEDEHATEVAPHLLVLHVEHVPDVSLHRRVADRQRRVLQRLIVRRVLGTIAEQDRHEDGKRVPLGRDVVEPLVAVRDRSCRRVEASKQQENGVDQHTHDCSDFHAWHGVDEELAQVCLHQHEQRHVDPIQHGRAERAGAHEWEEDNREEETAAKHVRDLRDRSADEVPERIPW
ncbi:hypothetical protein ON010_g18994 [Phytophthora cinnamomi]|nr:hypothetical protein ON010_g18994 [Phytophthora cinnamomi]